MAVASVSAFVQEISPNGANATPFSHFRSAFNRNRHQQLEVRALTPKVDPTRWIVWW